MITKDPLDLPYLDSVLKKTISTVESSREQIFDIAENARSESDVIREELSLIKQEVDQVIEQTDQLERKFRASRQKLVEVSRNFNQYSEHDVKKVYEQSSHLQIELSLSREKELSLRKRRDELEKRLRSLLSTIEKAETLMTQISVVLGYLTGELGDFGIALESAHEREKFSMQIIHAQEEERKRVARDIHDGPAQSMANVVIRTDFAERLLNYGRVEEAKKELKNLKDTVKNTLGEVRKIIFDLRPMALDDLGLVPTLRKYLKDFQDRYQITTELITMDQEKRLPSSVEIVAFRMLQEALNNVWKHAQAQNVRVTIEIQASRVMVIVTDDGIGFDKMEKKEQPNFGIMGMQERMKLIDGKIEIHSEKGKGTRVVFTIPLQVTAMEEEENE